jgi:hypothetical protein
MQRSWEDVLHLSSILCGSGIAFADSLFIIAYHFKFSCDCDGQNGSPHQSSSRIHLDTEVLEIWNPDNLKQGGIQF